MNLKVLNNKLLLLLVVQQLLCFSACCFADEKVGKTQVVIIGTIHFRHYHNPKYRHEVLKEIILRCQPDAILIETPSNRIIDQNKPPAPLYISYPESWAIDRAAATLKVKQIPIDMADRDKMYKETDYFKREKRAGTLYRKWENEISEKQPDSLDLKIAKLWVEHAENSEIYMFSNCGPDVINSDAHDSVIRIKKCIWSEILPSILDKYDEYKTVSDDYRFSEAIWQKRNKIIAENIIEATKKYPGKKLVAVVGATHRYILRDLLINEPCIDLKEYWEVTDFNLEKFLVSLEPFEKLGIKVNDLTKEQAAKKVVKEYWHGVIKADWDYVNILRPPQTDTKWKTKYSDNPPIELIETKGPYYPRGTSSGPVVPCVVKFENGKIYEINMMLFMRKVDRDNYCFLIGTWGNQKEISVEE